MSLLSPFLTALRLWFVNPRCTWCGQRTNDIERHYHDEHAGDEWIKTSWGRW